MAAPSIDPAQQLRDAITTPIARLNPELDGQEARAIQGEVTITWPYNSVTHSIAFLLADLDVLARRDKGLVKLQLSGASATAFAQAAVGAGDEVKLSLLGVHWASASEGNVSTRSSAEWVLEFSHRLLAEVAFLDSGEVKLLDIDASPDLEIDRTVASDVPTLSQEVISTPIEDAVGHATPNARAQPAMRHGINEYASPAFVKRARVSYGVLWESELGEDELEPDGGRKGRGRKKPRYSVEGGMWRVRGDSPSPEPEIEQSASPSAHGAADGNVHHAEEMLAVSADNSREPVDPQAPTMIDESCQPTPVAARKPIIDVLARDLSTPEPLLLSPVTQRHEGIDSLSMPYVHVNSNDETAHATETHDSSFPKASRNSPVRQAPPLVSGFLSPAIPTGFNSAPTPYTAKVGFTFSHDSASLSPPTQTHKTILDTAQSAPDYETSVALLQFPPPPQSFIPESSIDPSLTNLPYEPGIPKLPGFIDSPSPSSVNSAVSNRSQSSSASPASASSTRDLGFVPPQTQDGTRNADEAWKEGVLSQSVFEQGVPSVALPHDSEQFESQDGDPMSESEQEDYNISQKGDDYDLRNYDRVDDDDDGELYENNEPLDEDEMMQEIDEEEDDSEDFESEEEYEEDELGFDQIPQDDHDNNRLSADPVVISLLSDSDSDEDAGGESFQHSQAATIAEASEQASEARRASSSRSDQPTPAPTNHASAMAPAAMMSGWPEMAELEANDSPRNFTEADEAFAATLPSEQDPVDTEDQKTASDGPDHVKERQRTDAYGIAGLHHRSSEGRATRSPSEVADIMQDLKYGYSREAESEESPSLQMQTQPADVWENSMQTDSLPAPSRLSMSPRQSIGSPQVSLNEDPTGSILPQSNASASATSRSVDRPPPPESRNSYFESPQLILDSNRPNYITSLLDFIENDTSLQPAPPSGTASGGANEHPSGELPSATASDAVESPARGMHHDISVPGTNPIALESLVHDPHDSIESLSTPSLGQSPQEAGKEQTPREMEASHTLSFESPVRSVSSLIVPEALSLEPSANSSSQPPAANQLLNKHDDGDSLTEKKVENVTTQQLTSSSPRQEEEIGEADHSQATPAQSSVEPEEHDQKRFTPNSNANEAEPMTPTPAPGTPSTPSRAVDLSIQLALGAKSSARSAKRGPPYKLPAYDPPANHTRSMDILDTPAANTRSSTAPHSLSPEAEDISVRLAKAALKSSTRKKKTPEKPATLLQVEDTISPASPKTSSWSKPGRQNTRRSRTPSLLGTHKSDIDEPVKGLLETAERSSPEEVVLANSESGRRDDGGLDISPSTRPRKTRAIRASATSTQKEQSPPRDTTPVEGEAIAKPDRSPDRNQQRAKSRDPVIEKPHDKANITPDKPRARARTISLENATDGFLANASMRDRLATDLPENVSLDQLKRFLGKPVEVAGVVTSSGPSIPSRTKARQYMMTLRLFDPSLRTSRRGSKTGSDKAEDGIEVQFYRAHQESLPICKPGDSMLLRGFTVISVPSESGYGLKSGEESGYAVYDMNVGSGDKVEEGNEVDAGDILPQICGPPMEISESESKCLVALKRWGQKQS